MSSSPRINRRKKVSRTFTKNNYRKAFPFLVHDFEGRCAYSMQHVEVIGDVVMHIDHFDPRLKKRYHQPYANLNLASNHCNTAKGAHWPKPAETALGVRFLNPCIEPDYGVHIFEDPQTHQLVGTTPAGKYQILMCGLNASHLILERRERTALGTILHGPGKVKSDFQAARDAIKELHDRCERKIPPIPPPPLTRCEDAR
jgi:hypothetical protein